MVSAASIITFVHYYLFRAILFHLSTIFDIICPIFTVCSQKLQKQITRFDIHILLTLCLCRHSSFLLLYPDAFWMSCFCACNKRCYCRVRNDLWWLFQIPAACVFQILHLWFQNSLLTFLISARFHVNVVELRIGLCGFSIFNSLLVIVFLIFVFPSK